MKEVIRNQFGDIVVLAVQGGMMLSVSARQAGRPSRWEDGIE